MRKDDSNTLTIMDRLAEARDADEAIQILGRRRLLAYPLGFLAIAVAAIGYGAYLIVEGAVGGSSPWLLAQLPACVALGAFFSGFPPTVASTSLPRAVGRPTGCVPPQSVLPPA